MADFDLPADDDRNDDRQVELLATKRDQTSRQSLPRIIECTRQSERRIPGDANAQTLTM